MADIFTVEKRSEIMRAIKSKNTGPERRMAGALRDARIRFKMYARIIGKPDFVIPDMGIILFVDGEFWHGHTMTAAKRGTLTDFWRKKIDRNVERDREVNSALREMGWHVIRVTDREVNCDVRRVVSRIWRAHGQLVGKRRKTDPETRTAALNKTLVKKNTRCRKMKTSRQAAPKRPARTK
jgi:DNA mismatch endonuclease (patch repair protein)